MSEKVIMLLFNVFTLLIILVVQLLTPRISRKDILLGVKLPDEKIQTPEIEKIIKGYTKENIIIGIPLLILIVSLIYIIDNINLFVFFIFLYMGILFLVHLRWNRRIKNLKKEQEWDKLSSKILIVDTKFSKDRGKTTVISQRWFLIPLVIIISNFILTFVMYPSLPEVIPTHWDITGNIDGYMNKSIIVALIMPITQTFIGMVFYFSYYFMMKSKQQINPKNPEISVKKNIIFRRAWSLYFIVTLTIIEIIFTWSNIISLGIADDMKLLIITEFVIFSIIIIWSVILSIRIGQGGDRIKLEEEKEVSLDYDIDDDKLWKLGSLVYYNKKDPAIFVEKRVGIGWTVNTARTIGMIILVLPFIIVALTILLIK